MAYNELIKNFNKVRDYMRDFYIYIPIVAMTANAFEEDRKKAFDAGMNAHIAKPIDIEKLRAAILRMEF